MSKRYHEYQQHKVGGKITLKPTGSDIIGPFYLPNSPVRSNLFDKTTIAVCGRVVDIHGDGIANAKLDVWQANEKGEYDESGPVGRGIVTTDNDGYYQMRTVAPGDYKISEAGQPDEFRCAHIHFMISAEGYKPLTTQLYFPIDPFNSSDAWFNASRVMTPHVDWEGVRWTFQFVLAQKDTP